MARSIFIAVGQDGLRAVSEDGKVWEKPQLGKEGETYRTVTIGRGRVVAVGSYGGNNIFAASADGKTWKSGTHDAKYSRYLRGSCFGKDFFLALGGDPGSVGSSKPFVMTSEDGIGWKEPLDIRGKEILRRAVCGNERFVGVGDRGRRSVSADGRDWQDVPKPKALETLIDVAFGNGVFVGVGLHGLRMSTKDGKTWSEPQRGEEGEHLNSVVWAKDHFIAVGAGATYLSPNGNRWERRPNRDAPTTVAYGNDRLVGARWKGQLLYSSDGVEWKEATKFERNVEALCFGDLESK